MINLSSRLDTLTVKSETNCRDFCSFLASPVLGEFVFKMQRSHVSEKLIFR